MARACASAPGKAILVGEHFVVEGQPAIAVAVDLRARAIVETTEKGFIEVSSRRYGRHVFTEEDDKHPLYPVFKAAERVLEFSGRETGLRINIHSSIPPAAGLGSSAAVAVATVAATASALGEKLSLEDISRLAYEAEKIVHGKPSGIDNTVSTYGGAILYKRSEGFTRLKVDFSDARLVLADSGITRNTGAMVARVRNLYKKYPSVLAPLYEVAGRLVQAVKEALEEGDFETVGELMNINHGLLSAVGVSNIPLEVMVHIARNAGALGAKITGAGGGGLTLALCRVVNVSKVRETLMRVSKRVFTVNISVNGVRTEPSPS